MFRSFGKPPEASLEASPELGHTSDMVHPQFSKHGIITGIVLFTALSFLLSIFALRARPDQLTGANAPSPSEVLQFSSNLSSQNELIERELGPPPEGEGPTPEETAQFIKEIPDRFADVAAKLDAPSRREGSNSQTPQKSAKPRNISSNKINKMAANARSEFKDVNQALGISSSATDLEAPAASAIPWSDLGSAELDDISPAEKQRIASAAIEQTAAAFQQILPLHDAPGVTLFAVEAAHTTMHSRYRMSRDIDPAGQNEAVRALRRRACLGATMDMTLRLGGQYEYVLYDAGGLIIDRFTITENSCA